MFTPVLTRAIGVTAVALCSASSAVAGILTEWVVPTGDWSDPESWSDGEPTASAWAIIVNNGSAHITSAGEVCSRLLVGLGGMTGEVRLVSGDLTVTDEILVGDGFPAKFTQLAGAVTGPVLAVRFGVYELSGGSLVVESCEIGGGAGLSAMNVSPATTFVVVGACALAPGASLLIAGGTVMIGSTSGDALEVRGGLRMVDAGSISVQNLTIVGDVASLQVGIRALEHPTIEVAGTFTQDGRLIVNDFGAPAGRYDVVSAGAVAGAFVGFEMPPGWTSGLDGTTLWVEKQAGTPAAAASWSTVKGAFAGSP